MPAPMRARTNSSKKLQRRVRELTRTETALPVEVGAFDEHRVGLKPILRKIWAPRGWRPVAAGHHRFQWLYLYGFVRPATGEVVWFLADAVNTARFSALLGAVAREVGAGPTKSVILVLDRAGWHVSADVVIPDGVEVMFLPPYSPELQPAEKLWPLTNEPIANQYFETLSALGNVLAERCCTLADDPDLLKAHTLFHGSPASN
jgi:hypothetical protein